MFKILRKLNLPFLPKKIIAIPIEDIIVEVEAEAKNYPLILDNEDIRELFKNKFIAKNGAQVPPKEFIAKIITHIENSDPQSREAFAIFVRNMIATIPAPVVAKKRWFRRK